MWDWGTDPKVFERRFDAADTACGRGMPRVGPSPACDVGGLAGYDAPIPAADPVGDQSAVLLRCLLPCEMTGVERVNLAARQKLVEILVVRPRHELVVPACHDLGRGRDRRQQVPEHRVLLGVVPYEPGRLRKPAEVVCAYIVLVDLRLSVARCGRLDRVADIGSGVEPADIIQAGGLDDVLECPPASIG